MQHVKWVSALGIVAGLGWAAPAAAQKVDGAVHVGLGTEFVSYTKLDYTMETGLPVYGDIDGKTSTTRWGLGDDNGVVVEVGYGLDDMFVLGGFLQLGGQTLTEEVEDQPVDVETDTDTFGLLIGPKLDIMFLPNKPVRPYVTVMAGLGYSSTEVDPTNGNHTKTSATMFHLQAGGGIRWFAAEGFSLDPALVLGWGTGSGEHDPDWAGVDRWDLSGSALHVGLSLTASGWIL